MKFLKPSKSQAFQVKSDLVQPFTLIPVSFTTDNVNYPGPYSGGTAFRIEWTVNFTFTFSGEIDLLKAVDLYPSWTCAMSNIANLGITVLNSNQLKLGLKKWEVKATLCNVINFD